jgi:uncharacterized protein (TIGR02391 family)
MDKRKALDLLRQALDEIPSLKGKNYDNQDFELWVSKLENIIKASLDKDDYESFETAWPHYFLYSDAPQNAHQERYQEEINMRETALKSIIQKYEILGIEGKPAGQIEPKDTAKSPIQLFDSMQLHPRIKRVSRSLFNSGHYAEAIFAAFKAVNNFTKRKTGLQLDGKDLMAKTFNEDRPIIRLNKLSNQTERDEQEGFRFLFMGAMVGIRNPKAHEDIRQIDPYKALEYLSFASLLMRRATEGKLEKESK